VWRYEPRTEKLDVFVSYPFANPWGHVIDAWGQNFVSDASNGYNYWGTAFSGHVDYPNKQKPMKEWTLTRVRPTAGSEFVRSRHFPESAQGNFLYNNPIGFLGIKQYKTVEEGSGFVGVEVEPLLQSTDPNFRPVAMQFGPDGDLYGLEYGSVWFGPAPDAKLVRIEYNAGNRAPEVEITSNVTGGALPFSATLSKLPWAIRTSRLHESKRGCAPRKVSDRRARAVATAVLRSAWFGFP
jgi:hypothetical protein